MHVQRVFRQLRAFIFERLLTTPMEEEERHQYLREITIRDRKNSEMIDRLESELRVAQGEKVCLLVCFTLFVCFTFFFFFLVVFFFWFFFFCARL